ncbi:GNAT family acetyltransferase [Aspergillus luchuensis]|uniref:GNAT family acetyltransferase n=1 Tax=Aspergillus kawachii TaxID=1069201 RepID=A0A146FL20_ASPKA|nr:GNAT family acetyltransferase [Aspergillus luchuensis]
MPFTIRYATEQDAPHLANINVVSFNHQALWSALFPNVDVPGTLPLKTARCLDKLRSPQVHVVVAVDDDSGKVIGYSRWWFPTDYDTSVVELSSEGLDALTAHDNGKAYPEGLNMEAYQAFKDLLADLQRAYLEEDDIMLEFLATLPEAQGNGVGTALLKWGIERADARNARVYLEATKDGYPLYWKHGWRDLQVAGLDFTKYGSTGSQEWVAMRRDMRKPVAG